MNDTKRYAEGSVAPVLFVVFNRPDLTVRTIEAMRRAEPRPTTIYVAADGPRSDQPEDIEKVSKTREVVLRHIDWTTDVHWRAQDQNLGCRDGVSTAISWFFEQVDEGIIVEDDCMPGVDFFRFCSTLLDRYRLVDEIGHIGGFNYQHGQQRGNASYYYSRILLIWGWATWRSAWLEYDAAIPDFAEFVNSKAFRKVCDHQPLAGRAWRERFRGVFDETNDTWDYQWLFLNFKKDRLGICPNVNLVENIGRLHPDAVHERSLSKSRRPDDPVGRLGTITYPNRIRRDRAADAHIYRYLMHLNRWKMLKAHFRRHRWPRV